MKRRLHCKSCGTTKNSATGKPLYILGGENHVMLHSLSNIGECWDCGEKRREIEDKKRQTHLSRLMEDET